MDEMEEKIGAVLSNPQLMQQIMSMAQAMGGGDSPKQAEVKQEHENRPAPQPMPEIDLRLIQKLSGLASQNSIDRQQQALLKALSPYLQKERIHKLEKAMRAAKMARFASSALGQGALQSLLGR